jgi:curved DNA-binding protein CbpA
MRKKMNVAKAIALLGLTDQDDKSIQIAWKRKLLRTHPDKSNAPAATALTQEINSARDFLLQHSKHLIQAHLDGLAAAAERAALECARQAEQAALERARQAEQAALERARQAKEKQAALERARQAKEKQAAAVEQEMRAALERTKQAAERHNRFNTMRAPHSSILPPELQQSIDNCIQDNLNYEQARRIRQLRYRQG